AGGPKQGKVGLVSGGGSGHEPLHGGFVGLGMLDAACAGNVFTSPTPDQMEAATRAVDGGAGVLHIVKNYTGDVLNFQMAAELVAGEVEVASVVTNDDVAVQDSLYTAGRRGGGVTVLVDEIAEMLLEPIVSDLGLKAGDSVLAFVNGMGGSPLIELYVAFNSVSKILKGKGVAVGRSLVGNYITSLEMAGFSVTLLRLDDELTRLWDAPVHTPALRWGV